MADRRGLRISKRTQALVLLTLQNASISLLTRQSRIGDPKNLYLPSVAVFSAEVLKALVSLITLCHDYRILARGKKEDDAASLPWVRAVYASLTTAVATRWKDLAVLLVPSILYAGQNNLLYVALSNLPASVYQVSYQLKILATAVFSAIVFGRRYSAWKWFALLLLTLGVAIVQTPSKTSEANIRTHEQDQFLGFAAVIAASVSSAVAGCYFEAILKPAEIGPNRKGQANGQEPIVKLPPAPPLAMRNLQLALVSMPVSLLGILASSYDRERISQGGLLTGFNILTWFVVANQALGGLLIATVVNEADSVSKGFATSLAVILSTAWSCLLSRSLPSFQFQLGALLVVSATCLFAIT